MSYNWETVGNNGGNSSSMVNSMSYSWNNWGSMQSCMMGNWGMYCSYMMNSMGNSWYYWWSMYGVVNWGMMNSMGNSWDNWGSMERSVVGNGVNCLMGQWMDSVMSDWVDWHWDWFAVLVKFGFGKEWIEQRIRIKSVQFGGSIAVNSIPCFTSEKMLVKQCSIWTDKPSTMGTVSSVFTNTVGLTSRVYISIHARLEGSLSTQELGVWSLGQTRIVNTSVSRDAVFIVMFFVVGLRVVGSGFWAICWGGWVVRCLGRNVGRGRGVGRSGFMISWGRWMIGSRGRFMINWGWGVYRSGFMIYGCRGVCWSGFMIHGGGGVGSC